MILVSHIELKILTENAGLQSHKKSYAKKHDMPFWRKFDKHLKRLTQPQCATSVRISFTSRHCFEKLIDQNDLPCTLHKEKKNTDVDGGVFMSTAHVYFRFIQQYGGPDGDYFCLYKYYNYQLLRKMKRYLPHQIRPALDSLRRESAAEETIKKPFWRHWDNIAKNYKLFYQTLVKVTSVNFLQNRPKGVATNCCDSVSFRDLQMHSSSSIWHTNDIY